MPPANAEAARPAKYNPPRVRNGLIKGLIEAALVILISGSAVRAQPAETKTLRAQRISSPVRIDGVLDDPAWRGAEAAADFVQQDPNVGEPVSEMTDVRVLIDHE